MLSLVKQFVKTEQKLCFAYLKNEFAGLRKENSKQLFLTASKNKDSHFLVSINTIESHA